MDNTTHNSRRSAHKEEAQSTTSHDAASVAQSAAPASASITIAGLAVTVPVKFTPGHVLTATQAAVLDAAYQRQFTNNQNANAEARVKKLAKATTDEERAAAAPLTAEQIAALYADYEPVVGGAPRLGSMEKMRLEAAWRAWVALVTEHNKAILAKEPAVITRAGNKVVPLMRAATKAELKARNLKEVEAGTSTALDEAALEVAHKVEVTTDFPARKTAFLTALLGKPEYAERVQVQLDAITAERGAAKTTSAIETVEAGEDLL